MKEPMQIRSELHEVVDQLNEAQLRQILSLVKGLLDRKSDPVDERLKDIPGIKLPKHWPPRFAPVQPMKVEGELASARLIRERR